MKTVAFTTLGCRVNQYDTDAMKGLFLQNNYEAVDFDEKADIVRPTGALYIQNLDGEKDKDAKAREHKHMTFYEAEKLARDAQVGEMWLTHYSPSLTRPEEYMDDVRKIFPAAKAGKDRKSVELDFEKDE